MNSGINLISKKNDESIRKKKKVKKLSNIAFICLAVVSLLAVSLFIANRLVPLDSILREQESTRASLKLLEKKTARLIIVEDRAKDIADILQKRKSYTSIISTLLAQITGDVVIKSLIVDKNSISMVATSGSLASLDTFFNNLVDLTTKKEIFKTIVMDNMSLNDVGGEYTVSLKANLL